MNEPAPKLTDPDPAPAPASLRLGLVVPCFNEADQLPASMDALAAKLDALVATGLIRADSFVLLVDDGSTDATWALIEQGCADDPRFEGLRLAVNAGQQTAIFAGLQAVADRCGAALASMPTCRTTLRRSTPCWPSWPAAQMYWGSGQAGQRWLVQAAERESVLSGRACSVA